ncbi:MAG: Ig-like domain-containing protein [Gemmatimonadaceae bacterium]
MRARVLVALLIATVSCDSSGYVGQVVGFGSTGEFASLALTPSSASIAVGGTVRLVATPLDAGGQTLTGLGAPAFTTTNAVIAFVNDTGLVTGVSAGTVTVTATLTSGGVTRTASSAIAVTSGGSQGQASVAISDNAFSPSSLTVVKNEAGATVTWSWTGSRLHNVTFDDGGSGSANQTSGTFARTFTTAGTYTYYCSIHGKAVMSGSITVQ